MTASPARGDGVPSRGLVSVIIPTYNRASLITRAIDSACGQSWDRLQIIVADDGSTDDTERVVRERYAADPRVEYVRKPNSGVSATRNFALTFVRGDYIAFLDSDDEWQPWKIELQVALLARLPNVGMIWTNMDVVDDAGRVTASHCMRESYALYRIFSDDRLFANAAPLGELVPDVDRFEGAAAPNSPSPRRDTRVYWGDAFHAMALGNLCQPSTVMVTKARADAAGGFDETMRVGEDHEYHMRLTRAGDAALLDSAAIRYRRGAADQLTRADGQIEIARNYVRTIRLAVQHEADRTRVDAALLAQRTASAHAWVADEALAHREHAVARRHYFQSFLAKPSPRIAAKLAVSCLPSPIVDRILQSRSAK